MFGTGWGQFSHAYVIQLVRAPRTASYQNCLAERVARPLNAGIRAILTEEGSRLSQKVLTRAVMARNHVPHTATWISPALAMAGRCYLLSGQAATAWTRNPDTVDHAILQTNALSRILTARTAVMTADAERALAALAKKSS